MRRDRQPCLTQELLALFKAHGYEWPHVAQDRIEYRRTYAGHHQRSAGALAWTLEHPDQPISSLNIGSVYRARDLVRLGVAGTEIYRSAVSIELMPTQEQLKKHPRLYR
jgi:hypothetical protein